MFDDHCCQITSGGTYVPPTGPSRGLALRLDQRTRTATLAAQYTRNTEFDADYMGNSQPLQNSNVFVGWGSEPYFSEFNPGGQLLYDAHWHGSYQSYRAYRSPWTGTPAAPPAIAASASAPVNVYASWNGATEVTGWRVLAGASPSVLAPVAGAAKSGFETTIATPGPESYVAVQALDASGAVLGTSRTIKP